MVEMCFFFYLEGFLIRLAPVSGVTILLPGLLPPADWFNNNTCSPALSQGFILSTCALLLTVDMPPPSKKARAMKQKLKELQARGKMLRKTANESEEVLQTPPQPGPSVETQTPLPRPSPAKVASAKKRKLIFSDEKEKDIVNRKMYITMEEETRNIVNSAVCKICHGELECSFSTFGLESNVQLTCMKCSKTIYDNKPDKTLIQKNRQKFVPTYLQLVYSCMSGGVGYRCMKGIIASQGLPVMSSSVFERYKRHVTSVMKMVWKKHMDESIPLIFTYYAEELQRFPDHDGILDIDITYDGE